MSPKNFKIPMCLEDWPEAHKVQKNVSHFTNINRKWTRLNLEYTHARRLDDSKLYKKKKNLAYEQDGKVPHILMRRSNVWKTTRNHISSTAVINLADPKVNKQLFYLWNLRNIKTHFTIIEADFFVYVFASFSSIRGLIGCKLCW